MAGIKNASQAERNRRICLLRRNGFTYGEIATMEQISRPRVAQIVAATMPELGDEEGRAEVAGILEFVERKAVGLVNNPGPMMGPNGHPAVDLDGEQVPNNGIVVESLKILALVAEKKPKLFAWEKQPKKDPRTAEDEARSAMLAALAAEKVRMQGLQLSAEERRELEVLRSRAALQPPVIQGQVVRELRPGQQRGEEGS